MESQSNSLCNKNGTESWKSLYGKWPVWTDWVFHLCLGQESAYVPGAWNNYHFEHTGFLKLNIYLTLKIDDRLVGHHFALGNQIFTKPLKLNTESHFHTSIPSLNLLHPNMTLAYMVSNLNILIIRISYPLTPLTIPNLIIILTLYKSGNKVWSSCSFWIRKQTCNLPFQLTVICNR